MAAGAWRLGLRVWGARLRVGTLGCRARCLRLRDAIERYIL